MFRALILWFLLTVSLPLTVRAQEQPLDCYDGTTLNGLFSVTLPATNLENGEFHTVTAIATDAVTPRLHIAGLVPDVEFCLPPNPIAAGYQVTLNGTTVAPIADGAQETFYNETDMTVSVGTSTASAGAFSVIIEGGSFNPSEPMTDRTFDLNLKPDLIADGVPVTIAVFPQTEAADLSAITLTQDDAPVGESVTLDDAEISLYTLPEPITGDRAIGWQLTPDNATLTDAIQLSLGDVALNDVVIAMTFSTESDTLADELPDETLTATRTATDDGLTVTCGDDITLTNPLQIDLPAADAERTITVISTEGGDPVIMAFADDAETGDCVTDSPAAATYAANLPDYTADSSSNHPQMTVTDDATTIYTGSTGDITSQVLVIIEGATTDEPDVYGITPTQTMRNLNQPLAVYMLATDDIVNPTLSVVDAEGDPLLDADGVPIMCDDAGFDDRCYGITPTLAEASVTISAGQLNGFAQDALLLVPLVDQATDAPIAIQASESDPEAEAGTYVLMVQYVSD